MLVFVPHIFFGKNYILPNDAASFELPIQDQHQSYNTVINSQNSRLSLRIHCKNIRRFYGTITGNQQPVHVP